MADEFGLGGLAPGVDLEASRAAFERGRARVRRRRRWAARGVGASVVVATLAGALALAGRDSDGEYATPSCAEIEAFVEHLVSGFFVVDAATPADLARTADVVFAGVLTGEWRDGGDEVEITEVVAGDGIRAGDKVAVVNQAGRVPPPRGAPVVVFANRDDRWLLAVPGGFATACDGGPPIGDVGWAGAWRQLQSLDELIVDAGGRWQASPFGFADGVVEIVEGREPITLVGLRGRGFTSQQEGGEVVRVAGERGRVRDTATHDGRSIAVGDDRDFHPAVWISDDGIDWRRVHSPAFEVTALLTSVTVAGDRFLAVGGGGDRTVALVSDDGETWEPVTITADGTNDAFLGIVATDDVAMAATDARVFIAPADDLTRWEEVTPPGDATRRFVGLASTGDAFALLGSIDTGIEGGPPWETRELALWTSGEDVAFAITEVPDELHAADEFTVAMVGGRAGLVIVGRPPPLDFPTEECYLDAEWCARRDSFAYARIDDEWRHVQIPRLPAPLAMQGDPADAAVVGNELVLVRPGPDGLIRHDLATLPERSPRRPIPVAGPQIIEPGGTLELGVTRRYPLFGHCGVDYLGEFNGQWWYATEPQQTPTEVIYGEVTLVAPDLIEYRQNGALLATYSPTDTGPLPCG